MGLLDWLTGKQATDNQKSEMQAGANFLQEGIAQQVKDFEAANRAGQAMDAQTLAELQKEYANRMGILQGGVDRSVGEITAGEGRAAGAEQQRFAQQLMLALQGMGMDRQTLTGLMERALTSQQPASAAYGQMVNASLPAILGALGLPGGSGSVPLSEFARIQMEDTSRALRSGLQRQGLEGSGMASAQEAAARRRVAAEDQQSQFNRLMSLLTTGLSGSNQTAQTIGQYAGALGSLGGRLQSVAPTSLANIYQQAAQNRSGLYQQGAGAMAGLQSMVPSQMDLMSQRATQGAYNVANSRFQAPQLSANTAAQLSQIQAPSGLATLGQLAQIGSNLYGMTQGGGGGAQYGYFGKPGSWSNPTR